MILVDFFCNLWNAAFGTSPEAVIITRILKANGLDWPHRVYGDPSDDIDADRAEAFMNKHNLYTDTPVLELLQMEAALIPLKNE
jgi:hypothetical protein